MAFSPAVFVIKLFKELHNGLPLRIKDVFLFYMLIYIQPFQQWVYGTSYIGKGWLYAHGLDPVKKPYKNKTSRSTHIYEVVSDIISKIFQTNPYTFAIGVLAYAIIWLSRKISPLVPGALLAVVITSLISYFFNLQNFAVSLVGEVPSGIPSLEIPSADYRSFSQLWVGAIIISAFGLMEAVAIAKQLAIKAGDRWDPNQELIGQGLANIVAGLFKGFPVGGSFSRSALNYQLGAKTPIASVITGLVIGLTLLFLAPLFYYLPKATLSAIVLSAVINLIRPQEIIRLYRINPTDGIVAGVTFITVFFMDLWVAITLGTLIAFGSFVYKTMYPRIVILTRNPNSSTFVNAERGVQERVK